jgi:putative DNA primase/helicase
MNDDKDYMTQSELLEDIRKDDPDFQPTVLPYDPSPYDTNISYLRSPPSIGNFIPLDLSTMREHPPKPMEFVLSPILPEQGIGFVYAKTGLGKTLFCLNFAWAIAGGGNFLKYYCQKPRKVLYVDGEMPYVQLYNRILQIEKQQGELDFKENFKVLTPDKVLPFRLPMIDDPQGQDIYTEILQKHDIEVVIFDNLSMLSSFDENKANEWKPIQDWILYLRSIGKTVIIIHHAGKSDDYRGTSRMLDCADVAIGLHPINDDQLENEQPRTNRFKIVYRKSRVFGGQDAVPYEVNFENGIWSSRSMEQTELNRIVEMHGMKMSTREMAKELACGQTKACKLVRKAKDLKLIRD